MLKLDFMLQIMNQIDHCLKVIGLMKVELGGKIITKFVGLRSKPQSYLIGDGSEDKKAKGAKKCVIKGKLKFENYKICLEATQIQSKISHLEKNHIDIDSHKFIFLLKFFT